jgi:beta-glucanase (GH16 family)
MKPCCLLFLLATILSIQACDDGGPSTPVNDFEDFELQNASIDEGSTTSPRSLTVKVDGEIHTPITVTWTVKEQTAKFVTDLDNTSGDFELTHENPTAEISIPVIGDANFEISETFQLVVTYDGQEYPLLVTIKDDDTMPAILQDADGFYTPDTYPSMTLAWADEFSGTQLSTSNWTYEIGNGCPNLCGWGNNELESYTNSADNSKVENGKLTITAIEDDGQYTSARIKTQGKASPVFGRIDIRAKLPKGQGVWPAIWMLGENITTAGWPACGELDIIEVVGHEPAKVHGTVHYDHGGYQSSTGSTTLSSGDFSDKFHVFTIVWDKDQITWYVDNTSFKTFTKSVSSYPFNSNFFFIVNVAVGGNWPGAPDETTVFPQQMVVDYIRVFH